MCHPRYVPVLPLSVHRGRQCLFSKGSLCCKCTVFQACNVLGASLSKGHLPHHLSKSQWKGACMTEPLCKGKGRTTLGNKRAWGFHIEMQVLIPVCCKGCPGNEGCRVTEPVLSAGASLLGVPGRVCVPCLSILLGSLSHSPVSRV